MKKTFLFFVLLLLGHLLGSCKKTIAEEPKPAVLVRLIEPNPASLLVKGFAYMGITNLKVFEFSYEAKNGSFEATNIPILFWVSEKVRDVRDVINSVTLILEGDTVALNTPFVYEGYNVCLNFVLNPNGKIVNGKIIKGILFVNVNRMDEYIFPSGTRIKISIDPLKRRPGIIDQNNDSIQVNGAARGPEITFVFN
jgi:hypothetical protein